MGEILKMKDYKGKGTENNPFENTKEAMHSIYFRDGAYKFTLHELIGINVHHQRFQALGEVHEYLRNLADYVDENVDRLFGKKLSKKGRKRAEEDKVVMHNTINKINELVIELMEKEEKHMDELNEKI